MMKEITNSLKRRFIKDYSLPIHTTTEPIFKYLLELYEPLLQTSTLYDRYLSVLSKFENEEDYFKYYNDVKESIFDKIKKSESYQKYLSMDMKQFLVKSSYPTKNVYQDMNINQHFISIDLSKANFQALKYIDKSLVLNCDSYEFFMSKFTKVQHLKESKYLRQVIFGNMNPKQQVTIERFLIEKVLNYLLDNNYLDKGDIYSVCTDEIIVTKLSKKVDSNFFLENEIKDILNVEVHVEEFVLKQIISDEKEDNATTYGYIKEFIYPERKRMYPSFKSTNSIFFPQVFKCYFNKQVNDNDLMFEYEHVLSQFQEKLNLKIKETI